MVRTYMIFGGTGPILVVTKLSDGMQGEAARTLLSDKGLRKYIAYEVPAEVARARYGTRFSAAIDRMASDKDIRVVDMDGHHVFNNFAFTEMGEPVYVGGGAD